MTTRPMRVAPLREDQIEQAAGVVARAFQEYPLMISALPDPDERARLLLPNQICNVRHGYLYGDVSGIGEPLTGVLVVYPPGDDLFSEERKIQSGYYQAAKAFGVEAWERANASMISVFDYAEEDLALATSGRYWYLEVIAVEPARQGNGLGGLLLDDFHTRTDSEGMPTVLITHDARAIPFYLRHGFEIVCGGSEPTSGLRHWGFQRIPSI
jgi:GNAT superfamily N-acetyltransferase